MLIAGNCFKDACKFIIDYIRVELNNRETNNNDEIKNTNVRFYFTTAIDTKNMAKTLSVVLQKIIDFKN